MCFIYSKKQRAAKKRRVSFSSQLENVRFFSKENNAGGSPAKVAGTPAKPKATSITFADPKLNALGDHDVLEDDFEREVDLLDSKPSTSEN